ncbi:MAG TPA: ribosome silencing factor [Wenzhouxiangella sp.]|nr:ribosome silencing factor [Wenzhouxiangella sp.]
MENSDLLSPQALRDMAVEVAEDAKGEDIEVIDLMDRGSFADYMIIVSGNSSRHVGAIADRLVQRSKREGHQPLGVEGADGGEWVLVDLADVIVHVMQPQTRAYYNLEKLWAATTAVKAGTEP